MVEQPNVSQQVFEPSSRLLSQWYYLHKAFIQKFLVVLVILFVLLKLYLIATIMLAYVFNLVNRHIANFNAQ